ncbi:NAD(P)-dependent glycerol-3-phosphate dehydrogenase [Myxococcota bacterium]|nr:NAD(P)-dependent glycerol-3-phosphate dehydrogenase [Myxococcota bacterium]MBU1429524.1 NAD(P)-dependent glycerol-3-phosphate dehydrogenase [Myxococcota bacterium]
MKITVLGGGNWGTTVALSVARAGHPVTLWVRRADQRDEINQARTNQRYLPDITLPAGLTATDDLGGAVEGAGLILFIIPSKAFRRVAQALGAHLSPEQLIIHGTKGFEPVTHLRMSQILEEETCARQLGVLSGPNIAWEMASGLPAGATVASRFPEVIRRARAALEHDQLQIYGNRDVVGVELAGALKNVVAIAAGMAEAMAVGQNAKALLITRGMAEITRLGVALGAAPGTFTGVAGVGDLIVTCASSRSRNFRVGDGLAKGEGLDEITARLGQTAEGINTARVVAELLRERQIRAPLLRTIHQVIEGAFSPEEGLRYLMSLEGSEDVEFVGGDF